MKMRSTPLAVAGAALALAMAGCGGDDSKKNDSAAATSVPAQTATATTPTTPAPTTTTPTSTTETTPSEPTPPGGEQAAKDTILKWIFEGDCDVMTDNFLEDQAFIGDNRKERCAYFEKTFRKPSYSEDDVKFRSVKIEGGKASVVIGDDISNVETTYLLVAKDGKWQIDDTD